jgi:hypothetical protein
MKVFQLQDDWSMDNLTLAERPQPEPGPGQLLLKRYYGGQPGWNGGHDAGDFAARHQTRYRLDLRFRRIKRSPRLPGAQRSFWESLYPPVTFQLARSTQKYTDVFFIETQLGELLIWQVSGWEAESWEAEKFFLLLACQQRGFMACQPLSL